MLGKYITFNASEFMRDYFYYRGILEKMQDEYEALDGVSAVGVKEDRVQQTPSPDGLEKIALQRLSMSSRIEEYKQHIKTAEIAFALLDPSELTTLEYFFNPELNGDESMLTDWGLSRAQAYRIKGQALEKLAQLVCNTHNYT